MVGLTAPRISHLNKLGAIIQLHSFEYSVGVSVGDSNIILVSVTSSTSVGAGRNHPTIKRSFAEEIPHFIFIVRTVRVLIEGSTSEGLNGRSHPASGEHLKVAKKLGSGLLKDRHPHGAIWSRVCVHWRSLSIPVEDVIIDSDSDRDSHDVELDSVDTSSVEALCQENLLDSVWVLSYGGSGSDYPTISKIALCGILEANIVITPKRELVCVCEVVGDSQPL